MYYTWVWFSLLVVLWWGWQSGSGSHKRLSEDLSTVLPHTYLSPTNSPFHITARKQNLWHHIQMQRYSLPVECEPDVSILNQSHSSLCSLTQYVLVVTLTLLQRKKESNCNHRNWAVLTEHRTTPTVKKQSQNYKPTVNTYSSIQHRHASPHQQAETQHEDDSS